MVVLHLRLESGTRTRMLPVRTPACRFTMRTRRPLSPPLMGAPMHVFADTSESTHAFPDEAAFLPGLIGAFTDQIMSFVRAAHSNRPFRSALSSRC